MPLLSKPVDIRTPLSLTPLIDVVFLLLIFFMVTTTFSHETRLLVNLPEANAEAAITTTHASSAPLIPRMVLIIVTFSLLFMSMLAMKDRLGRLVLLLLQISASWVL